MSRDNYYSRLFNEEARRAPKILDIEGLETAIENGPFSGALQNAEFGEYRDESVYPADVYKTLHGFKWYGGDSFIIPNLGFDPNFDNQQFINFWGPISEHTQSFWMWLRNGHSMPVKFRPEHFNDEEDVFKLQFRDGELVTAEQYTLGMIETQDVTQDALKND
jgi:hypothetical protein